MVFASPLSFVLRGLLSRLTSSVVSSLYFLSGLSLRLVIIVPVLALLYFGCLPLLGLDVMYAN